MKTEKVIRPYVKGGKVKRDGLKQMTQKTRSTANLRGLPREQQEQVIEWCDTPKSKNCAGGYKYAAEKLAEQGVILGTSYPVTLSRFYNWWLVRSDFEFADDFAANFEALMKKEFPSTTPEKLSEAGQLAFTAAATRQKDPERFVKLEQLRLAKKKLESAVTIANEKLKLLQHASARDDEKLRLDIAKFQWDAASAAMVNAREIKLINADRSLNNDVKIRKVIERLFGKPPETLEALT